MQLRLPWAAREGRSLEVASVGRLRALSAPKHLEITLHKVESRSSASSLVYASRNALSVARLFLRPRSGSITISSFVTDSKLTA